MTIPVRRPFLMLSRIVNIALIAAAICILIVPRRTLSVTRQVAAQTRDKALLLRNSSRIDIKSGAITEFFDYECPICREVSPELDSLEKAGVHVVRRHFPLPKHAVARQAALVAICAENQHSFAAIHKFLMQTDAWMTATDSVLAATVGPSEYGRCLSDPVANARLKDDIALAHALRLDGVPAFVRNGKLVRGRPSSEWLTSNNTKRN